MKYKETLPDDIFSHHIESFWDVTTSRSCHASPLELFLPTCTFNIIFTDQIYFVKTKLASDWQELKPGPVFIGQTSTYLYIKSDEPIKLRGVRFKPFAFAKVLNTPIFKLNDGILSLDMLFDLKPSFKSLWRTMIKEENEVLKDQFTNELMFELLKGTMTIDERLRAQLNYILDRKGAVRINEIFKEFKVSKVTLRKHFVNKVGLSPKKVSQIWRMNYVLQLHEEFPNQNLTALCLEAGFYDQSHFIKDFKLLTGTAPKRFLAASL